MRLDQPAQSAAFKADPDAALRNRPEPVLLDEWQEVPEVLGAVKRAVDDDPHPGRFILTGSVRSDLEQRMWPGTGRLVRTRMYGLTEREIIGLDDPQRPSLIDQLESDDPEAIALPTTRPDLRDYIEAALCGGFPGLVLEGEELRDVWIDSCLEQLLTRDAHSLIGNRDQHKLARYSSPIHEPSISPNDAQLNIARILFSLPAADGFALAGGPALVVHGAIDRPTRDIDAFVAARPRTPSGDATPVTNQLQNALEAEASPSSIGLRAATSLTSTSSNSNSVKTTASTGRSNSTVISQLPPSATPSARSDGLLIPNYPSKTQAQPETAYPTGSTA